MTRRAGRTRGRRAIGLVPWVALIALAGCGGGEEGPDTKLPTLEPVGELGGPTVSLSGGGDFENILALDIDTGGEGLVLIAGQVEVGRKGAGGGRAAEVRIVVDQEAQRDAAVRSVRGDLAGETLVIACACKVERGLHEVEFQGRSAGGSPVPIKARSLVAVDDIDYGGGAPSGGGGPLPPAINGSALETGSLRVDEANAGLADLELTGAQGDGPLLVLAQVGTGAGTDPQSLVMSATVGGRPTDLLSTQPAGVNKLDTLLAETWQNGDSVNVVGRIVGGGDGKLDLRSVITCPCGIASG